MTEMRDVIGQTGLPRFFPVDGTPLAPPAPRRGEALRTAVRSVAGFQKEALVASARTGRTWRLVSDEGPYLNGHDAAPCPLAFFSTGMAASYLVEIEAMADRAGVALGALRLTLDNYYTMTGSMRQGTMAGGAEPIELTVAAATEISEAALHDLLVDAIHAAPPHGLVRGVHESLFTLHRNGDPVPTGGVRPLEAERRADPAGAFSGLAHRETVQPLCQPVGKTPRKEVAKGTADAGSSLSDEQDRRLNIGAVAERRQDGLIELTQMTYSPHGTAFRFLSSEDGRAPDAASLLSAGIGFCFMTQFGRHAAMQNLDLQGYRIVQDTHFSPGGASGGTGTAALADPVETHVFLDTDERQATAREMLDVAERTCFLHALCRTDLRVRLRVERP